VPPMTGIFISYREQDGKPWALLLRDALAEAFGEDRIFLDKDTLRAGNWREQIQVALDHCTLVLVVIGRQWLAVTDERGQRRVDRLDDVHWQEIALALARPGVTVIPVRVDGAPMPRAEELPADIRALTDQQARELSDSRMRRDVDLKLLMEDIERATGLKPKRPSPLTRDDGTAPEAFPAGQWLGPLARVVLITLLASIAIVVTAQIGLGWTFQPEAISFIVLIVLGSPCWDPGVGGVSSGGAAMQRHDRPCRGGCPQPSSLSLSLLAAPFFACRTWDTTRPRLTHCRAPYSPCPLTSSL
jgi:hypothetical protein